VSEELTTSATGGQNSTQTRSITLPDINFSIRLDVHVTVSPALQAALERIAVALTLSSEPVYYGLNREQTAELVKKGVVDPAIAGLDPAQKPFVFKGTMVERPDWIRVPGYKDLRYYEDGDNLFIKYSGSSAVETSWKQMVEFSRLPIEECKKARDVLLEKLKISGNTASATTVNCFVTAIQKGRVVPPVGIQDNSEKVPIRHETKSKKGPKVYWTDIPKHPQIRYREEAGNLILNYSGSIVETTWQQVENTARLDQKYWKPEIEKMLGNRQASNRRAAIGLFLKLVEKGDVSRTTFSQFQEDESTGVSA